MAPTPSFAAFSTISPVSVEPVIADATGMPGVCTFVDTISGTEKEEGQDRLSVQVGGCAGGCLRDGSLQ